MKTICSYSSKSVSTLFILLLIITLFSNNIFGMNSIMQNENLVTGESNLTLILIGIVALLAALCGYLTYKVTHLKKTKTLVGDEALTELNYAYINLKKEWSKQKETNTALKNRIDFLSRNVKELENANYELLKQREKLVNNENRLLDLQKRKEELFSIAVHDIKNPAAAIRSYVELLEGYDLNAVEQQEIVKYLVDSTDQIISLAQKINNSVLDEETSPGETEKKEAVSLHKVVKSIIAQNIGYANKKQVKIINKTTQDTPKIYAQKSRIEEVIFNLINNSIKFSPPGTVVFVKSYFTEKNVSVEVVDNGVGIAEKDINRAFTKRGILSAKPTGDEESSGLGLWIVKKIIEEHKGQVWLESKENVGSTFGFKLPVMVPITED